MTIPGHSKTDPLPPASLRLSMGVSHKIFAPFARTATTASSASRMAMVASSGHRAILVGEQERPMIDEGDGSFERKLNNRQCPRCRSAIRVVRDEAHKREYDCTVCNLKIIDVKGDTEG